MHTPCINIHRFHTYSISTVLTEQHNHDRSLCDSRSDDDYQRHHTPGPRPFQTNRSHHSIPLLYKEGINPTTNDVTLFLLPMNSIYPLRGTWHCTCICVWCHPFRTLWRATTHILHLYWVHTLAKYRCTQYHDLYLNLIWIQNKNLEFFSPDSYWLLVQLPPEPGYSGQSGHEGLCRSGDQWGRNPESNGGLQLPLGSRQHGRGL